MSPAFKVDALPLGHWRRGGGGGEREGETERQRESERERESRAFR